MGSKCIWKAGIKKQKGSLIGIAFLMFLVSLSLAIVAVLYFNGKTYMQEELERAGFGDLTAWVSDVPEIQRVMDEIEEQEEVTRVTAQELLFTNYEANGVESDSEGQLILWNAGEERYRFLTEDFLNYQGMPEEITTGTVYISPAMVSMMNLQIGDTITFPVERGEEPFSLTVAGYYEDPWMGSSMIGMKGFLIGEADYEFLMERITAVGIDALARPGYMLHIFAENQTIGTVSQLNGILNEETSIAQYTEFIHSADTMSGFMLILQNAFCGLLAAFVLILLGVTMIILGHSISGMIEQEYKNLGILKTIGFTGRRLIKIQLLQYLTAIGIGLLLGLLAASPLAGLVSRTTITTTGLRFPSRLPVFLCVLGMLLIIAVLAGFAAWKLRKIQRITPQRAIRGEAGGLRWEPKGGTVIRGEGLALQLAFRQLLAEKRRYVGACLVAVLLVFFASLTGRMNAWLGPEGKGMMDAFNPADLDIGVQILGERDVEEMEQIVQSYGGVTDRYLLAMPSVSVEGTNYTANVITEPERFHISRGRTCIAEDEVVLTEVLAADLGVSLGDTVNVRGDMSSGEYTVSGIYHCANDMGANLGMSREGYLRIGQDDARIWCYHYFLADPEQKTALTEMLENTYGGDVHVHENSWPGLYGILTAMQGLLLVMYGLIAIFVLVVTVMTGQKLLVAEQKDIGIYRAMGCSPALLRRMFAFRFGIAALLGAMIGTILAVFLTDPIVSAVMRLAGISNFSSYPTWGSIVLPGAVVTLLFVGFAYLARRKIKKMDMSVLTAE